MSETERIAAQMGRAFVGEAWHGPALMELLEGLGPQQASARPLRSGHTIWEIVLHISAWKEVVHQRLQGKAIELSPAEDWPAAPDNSEAAWVETLEQLKRAHNELERAVAAFPDARLTERVPGRGYDVYFMLHGLVQHDLYHAGQIALLKKAM
jgi:uncharacterized damage-inducible protein DinB